LAFGELAEAVIVYPHLCVSENPFSKMFPAESMDHHAFLGAEIKTKPRFDVISLCRAIVGLRGCIRYRRPA
jgi:hypothetical protein